jgi:hypothetical protein
MDSTSATAGSGIDGLGRLSRDDGLVQVGLGWLQVLQLLFDRLLFLDGFVRVFHGVLHDRPPPGRDRLDCARIVLPSSADATEAGATTLARGDPFPF